MSKFKPGPDPRRNQAGRPRGRIAEFRELVGNLTGNGAAVAERLLAIINDPASTKKEVIDASALVLSYLLGKPEQAVSVEADITAGPPMLDGRAIAARLPGPVLDALIKATEDAPPLALLPGDEG